jgi:Holliday junction resolvase RusA-like endonuclease
MHFIIPIEPSGKKEARRTLGGHVYTDEGTRKAMELISDHVRVQYRGEPLDEPLWIEIKAYRSRPKGKAGELFPATKPDYDNIAKLIGDALEGILWVNDSRIVDGRISKLFVREGERPRIELKVKRCSKDRVGRGEVQWL